MEYKALLNSIHGNSTLLFRQLLEYDSNFSSLILKCDGAYSFVKEFTSKNKNTNYYNNSDIIKEFLEFAFELGYDPMRNIIYHPYLKEWGKSEHRSKNENYCEITSLWFDLSDENQHLLLDKTGPENIKKLVTEGYHFLHYAFKQNHHKTIELLSSFGLDYSAKDNFGKSVRDYAQNSAVSLDLYLKLNTSIDSNEKFDGLKSWFIENIKEISPYKYQKSEQMQTIQYWINDKWNNFNLEQKQEILSLSIGSNTKDIFSLVSQLVEDKKTLLSSKYPFWMNLDHCKVKQLAFSSIKNIHPTTYNAEKDIFFVEKLALMFNNFNLPTALSQPTPKDDLSRIKALWESYGRYKDIWISHVKDDEPFFHTIAKRKNEVFKIFGKNWLNITSPNDLLGSINSSSSYLMDNDIYSVQRHDNQGNIVNVIKLKIEPVKVTGLDLINKTWLYKDKDDKYTFEYFLENHYESISYSYKPNFLDNLKNLMKDYSTSLDDKSLDENKMIKLEAEYQKYIEPVYPIDVIFKLLVSCSKVYDKMTGYNIYGLDSGQISDTMRSCYNILRLTQYKDMFDYGDVQVSPKLQKTDHMLYHDLSALILESKLNRELAEKPNVKTFKI